MLHLTLEQLSAGLDDVRGSPTEVGQVMRIVRRPVRDEREVLSSAQLDPDLGVVGDSWLSRTGGSPNAMQREAQITLMNARFAALVAGEPERWQLAGDQLYVDFDLSLSHLPAGTYVGLGSAVLRISEVPHTGCKKFAARFGDAALAFVNSDEGHALRLRRVNARVVTAGEVRVGDAIRRVTVPAEAVSIGSGSD